MTARWLLVCLALAAVLITGWSPLGGRERPREVSLPATAESLAARMEADGIYGATVVNVRCEARSPREFFCRGDYTDSPEIDGLTAEEQRNVESVFSGPAAWTVTVDKRGVWNADDLDEEDLAR